MSKMRKRINAIFADLLAGDASARDRLFKTAYRHLMVIAALYALDKNDCEDIVQESFLKAYRYVYSVNLNKDGYNWLCKIVQNVAYDFYRHKQPPVLHYEFTFNDVEMSLEERDELLREIQKLSKQDQQILYLRFWDEIPYCDIANRMHLSRSATYLRSKKLQRILKKKLKGKSK